eukprot:XP_022265464.1 G-protein coupled receptor 35-like isoform X1 [Canis lupus familiaris]
MPLPSGEVPSPEAPGAPAGGGPAEAHAAPPPHPTPPPRRWHRLGAQRPPGSSCSLGLSVRALALPWSPWPGTARLALQRGSDGKPTCAASHLRQVPCTSEAPSRRPYSQVWRGAPQPRAGSAGPSGGCRPRSPRALGRPTAASPLPPADPHGLEAPGPPAAVVATPGASGSVHLPAGTVGEGPPSCAGRPRLTHVGRLGCAPLGAAPFQPSRQTLPCATVQVPSHYHFLLRQVACALPSGAASCPALGPGLLSASPAPSPGPGSALGWQGFRATEAMSANGTCARPHPTWVENVDRTYTGALLVLGLLLNGLALWVLCCRMRPWTETRVYMVNLAAADLCLLCALPFFLHSLKDTTDTVSCQLSQGIYLANRYLSIGLITAIAVDRYVAVRHPLCARGLRSPRQAAAVCAALWVLVGSSLVLRWALGVQEGGFCFRNPARQSAGTTLFSLLGFYPPLAVLGFCSLQVVAALAERPASGPHQAQATRRATRMVWANLAVFVLCFLPFHVVLTVYAAAGRPTPALCYALYVTGKLSDANCCLDAIGYYFVAKEFQEATLLASVPVAKAHRTQDSLSVTLA